MLIYAVVLSRVAQKEIRSWPLEVRKDVGSVLTKLQKGHTLSMPEVRSLVMKKANKKAKSKILKTSQDLGEALGIDDPVEVALFVYKADLSILAVKVIKESGLKINEIVVRSGVARSKVSAIANGAVVGISHELFLKVMIACGKQIITKAA